MNKSDKIIRQVLISQAPEIPDTISDNFDKTLSKLVSSTQTQSAESIKSIKSVKPRIFKVCAALGCTVVAVLVSVIILANINRDIAYAMQDIPVIGNLFKVVTIYKKDTKNDYHYESINVPQIESQEGFEEQIDYINADVKQLTDAVIKNYEESAAQLPDSHIGLEIDYQVITNNNDWFTLKLILHYAAGSSNTEYHFYHIDKKAGKIVSLSDIFVEGYDYIGLISNDIIRQMNEQMDADPQITYWVKRENTTSFYEFESINENQNFYFDNDGNLVIVFQKYEVAPGSMGTCEFTINKSLFEKYLK